ncbi:hypothetical protein DPMN_096273 [Dreissena polymorpha]|uniref:Uncharacterized protein n=1 Tax=Dreissena polymorpha TaxID=45954 RepID=A0A9D4R3I1_DREPO|nr:hypothetical protein DPMN_096273 [Dreissena polymorpha]
MSSFVLRDVYQEAPPSGELVRVSSWGDWEVVHCSRQYKLGPAKGATPLDSSRPPPTGR